MCVCVCVCVCVYRQLALQEDFGHHSILLIHGGDHDNLHIWTVNGVKLPGP